LYFAIENKAIPRFWLLLALGAALYGEATHAAESDASVAIHLPAQFNFTGGQVTVKAFHPYRIVVLENRRISGGITIEAGSRFPSARMQARLSATEFRHASPAVEAEVAGLLLAKAHPEILFTSEIADVRPGRRPGESEVALSGELTIAGTKIDSGFPAICAITADSLHCRFDFPLRLSDLRLNLPLPLRIPFRDEVKIQGEWSAVRNASAESAPAPVVDTPAPPEGSKQESGQ